MRIFHIICPVIPWLHHKSSLSPVLSCCYPYLSQARGWTEFTSSQVEEEEEVSLTVRTDWLPDCEEDKCWLYLGLKDQAVTSQCSELWGELDGRRFCPITLQDSSSTVTVPVKPEPSVTISSLGIAPENAWHVMGQYEFRGIHNSAKFYVQSCTVKRFRVNYLYFTGAEWLVGPSLDGERASLKNITEDTAVPLSGWEVGGRGGGRDPHCTARTGPHQDCGEVTVSSDGAAGRKYPDHLGVFRATNMWSSGRRVYKLLTGEKYLCVPASTNNNFHWVITDHPGYPGLSTNTGKLGSSCGSNCPASSRARHHDNLGHQGWQYKHWLGFWRQDSSITVTCNRQTEDCN